MGEWFQTTAGSGSLALAVPVALVAGLVSFFSPCVIPLLPGYLSYATGLSGADLESARAALVVRAFTPEGRHVDPNADANGHLELNQMVSGVHALYPGFTIERTTGVDQHGDQLRFGWRALQADGSLLVEGLDVGELAEDGRLRRVAGFWGPLA